MPNHSLDELFSTPPLRVLLRRRYDGQPDAPALLMERDDEDAWLTYAELGRAVRAAAALLHAAVPHPDARVGVMLPNSRAFVITWLALIECNRPMVPVNIGLVGAGLRHTLTSARLDLLIVDETLLPVVTDACGDTPPAHRVLVRGAADCPGSLRHWALGTGTNDAHSGADERVPDARTALIIYTSGTTGPSKGVVLSRTAQLWHGMNYLRDFIQLGPGEVGFTPLPLFHVSAQGFTLGCLLGGAAVVVGERFSPFSFWATTRRHGVKAFNYVGAMLPLLYHRRPRADDADNPAQRAVGSATAPELHEPFERRFGLRLIESYGQSEMAGLWLTDPPEGRRVGSVGKPRRWLEARVVRPDGSPAATDEDGEIVVRAAHPLLMTRGYFDDAATTARAFPHGDADAGGWYQTGDVGSADADGYVRFRGRLKDVIRRRGENISAFEIEREALTHPAIREAAAVGVAATLGEEEVKLCVVPHEGAPLEPGALDAYLRPRLATFMRPRYIEVRSDFPRTPTRRIQKFKLRDEGITPQTWERGRQ